MLRRCWSSKQMGLGVREEAADIKQVNDHFVTAWMSPRRITKQAPPAILVSSLYQEVDRWFNTLLLIFSRVTRSEHRCSDGSRVDPKVGGDNRLARISPATANLIGEDWLIWRTNFAPSYRFYR